MLHAEIHDRLCGNQSRHRAELEACRNRAHCATPTTAAVYNEELCYAAHQSLRPQHGLLGPEQVLAAADILARPPCQHQRRCLATAVTCSSSFSTAVMHSVHGRAVGHICLIRCGVEGYQ